MNNIMYSFTVTPGMISLAIELLSVVITAQMKCQFTQEVVGAYHVVESMSVEVQIQDPTDLKKYGLCPFSQRYRFDSDVFYSILLFLRNPCELVER
jgi:hypothetical protein